MRIPMPRLARVVVPGIPHHVVQRGNHRDREKAAGLYRKGIAEAQAASKLDPDNDTFKKRKIALESMLKRLEKRGKK